MIEIMCVQNIYVNKLECLRMREMKGSKIIKMNYYKKIYPFKKSVFCEKFLAATLPLNLIKSITTPITGKTKNDRVFVGGIKNNKVTIITFPDINIWHTFIKSRRLFYKRLPLMMAPMCIYGQLSEKQGTTILNYTIDKKRDIKLILQIQCLFIMIIDLGIMLGVIMNGFTYNFLILIFVMMLVLFHICIFSMLKVSETEVDALIKFLETITK